jgi:hypothetical protein
MLRICSIFVVLLFIVSLVPADTAFAGWKENYREKYSKKQLDPNSEKAKSIRTLANMDFKYNWKRPEGERQRSKLLAESTDKFDGYSANFGPGNMGAAGMEDTGEKTGYTLTGILKSAGEKVGVEPSTTGAPPVK